MFSNISSRKHLSQQYLAVVPRDFLFCFYYASVLKLCGSCCMWHQFLSFNMHRVYRVDFVFFFIQKDIF